MRVAWKGYYLVPVVGAALLALCTISGQALAQTPAGAANKDPASERRILGKLRERLRERWNHLLHRGKGPVALSPAQQNAVDSVAKSQGTVNVSVLTVPDAATVEYLLSRPVKDDDRYAKIVLPLGGGRDVSLLRVLPTIRTDNGFTWRGKVEDTGEPAVLMLWRDGHLTGYFAYQGNIYSVSGVGGDVHAVAEIDPGKLPPDHAPSAKDRIKGIKEIINRKAIGLKVKRFSDVERKALEEKMITIDVMLLYTKNVTKHYLLGVGDALPLAIELANYTFRNSGLGNITLRLVHSQEIDFDETGLDQFNILYGMADATGPFKDVKRLRDEKRADIAGLIIDDPKGCGLSTRVGADAEEAFFVVHHACAAITYSIAHEIGHILGARHDRAVDSNDTPFVYGHGYVNGRKWRTMMGYKEACGGCPRIPFWSNPRIKHKGEPTGTAANDNARVILEQAERISKFR